MDEKQKQELLRDVEKYINDNYTGPEPVKRRAVVYPTNQVPETTCLKAALMNLKRAFIDVLEHCSDEEAFNDNYPFGCSYRELVDKVIAWVDSEIVLS